MGVFETVVLALIEGLTEFLPISSTGHMILASAAMRIHEDEFVKTFEVAIQLGAILAIALMYVRRFLAGIEIYLKLTAAFLPTAIIGFLAYKPIKQYLFSPVVVSVSLIVGGVILILIDRRLNQATDESVPLEKISYRRAVQIGLIQCLSMVPGTSRAAATIVGGVFNGLSRRQATEFSFLLAVPTMCAATGYDLLKTPFELGAEQWKLLGVGLVVAFASAWVAVRLMLDFVARHGFAPFGYYRIALGVAFLVWIYL